LNEPKKSNLLIIRNGGSMILIDEVMLLGSRALELV